MSECRNRARSLGVLKAPMSGPHDGCGNVGCMLCAFSLATTLSPEGMGKDGVSVVVMSSGGSVS